MNRVRVSPWAAVFAIFSTQLIMMGFATPVQAVDTIESRFKLQNELGDYELTLRHQSSFSCTNEPYDETSGQLPYSCSFTFLSKVDVHSGPLVSSPLEFLSGELQDKSGGKVGEWVTTWRPVSSKTPGWGKWRVGRATFQLVTSGEIRFTGKALDKKQDGSVQSVLTPMISIQLDTRDALRMQAALLEEQQSLISSSRVMKIRCSKGKTIRIVSGDPAICPKGFLPTPSSTKALQAFQACRLYKKGTIETSAQLSTNAKVLTLRMWTYGIDGSKYPPLFWTTPMDVSTADLNCVLKSLGASEKDNDFFRSPCFTSLNTYMWIRKVPVRVSCDPDLGLKVVVGE